ncbi:ubiquinone/menaquinone biosynthesis methyltransferase [Bryobacter aggregatus]|uniref:ubiquinone/menaquinone biosynthesis methyltransferase n=1 Tax=Bryobacter aggregatus TaxID=360054 RepID=UPI0004E1DA89|nr:ubiquinone/menaquinone biosynthesis methyltransferase [Bryobacter aggregatus]
MAATGTKPRPELSEAEASVWVRDMFGRVAPRYDLLNRLLSFQVDRVWRWRTARAMAPFLKPDAVVLDLCCGTGDLLQALERTGKARYIAADFCHPMLVQTRSKSEAPLVEADGLRLPIADGSLDLITIGFGFRNFVNYRAGVVELLRVLKPGGRVAILEFTTPPYGVVRGFMQVWNRWVMDPIGRLVSGQGDAYQYLPESVSRFPGAAEFAALMREGGFAEVSYRYFDLGIAALHVGMKKSTISVAKQA